MEDEERIRHKYKLLGPNLNERIRRLFAAAEAESFGHGGITLVSRATGLERHVIARGLNEIKKDVALGKNSVRKAGGGRKKNSDKDQTLETDLETLIEPVTRGDPESPLLWVSRSLRHLSEELHKRGHQISHTLVGQLLQKKGYSMQANRKNKEGTNHPDRNAQFEHINQTAKDYLAAGDPVVSVDTKKKELVGDFKNNGQEWRPAGNPEIVQMHDFPDAEVGKANPYGIYDLGKNEGWVNVGIDHDTAQFAVESIRQWWKHLGKKYYPNSKKLFITADCGGSNGARSRLWKVELQKLSNETGFEITISHFPPGTSKWNKIEHRLFSFISQNWRAKPLYDYATVINLIAATTTKTGLKVYARLDRRKYELGIKITDDELKQVNIYRNEFHGEWNYSIRPQKPLKLV